ncbi:uncharacterized protein EV420DRAFT_1521201 [Desarmillaria tabescens]|uniref:Secreted protein n=1 Tax=Armillaria tabescens TaxID=1929756 RepID=A0AA39NC83_ARMTA|nr:uncharacterized protein EV420DRAFT_1521201 [Desarmillaria tabescens]KAK0462833.1 hypothetical protein EV420DRAFT_1521201 [Desarmillaria tabescens]
MNKFICYAEFLFLLLDISHSTGHRCNHSGPPGSGDKNPLNGLGRGNLNEAPRYVSPVLFSFSDYSASEFI